MFPDTDGGVVVVDSGITIIWLDNQGKEILKKTIGGMYVIGATRQGITYTSGAELAVMNRRGEQFTLPRTVTLQFAAPVSQYTNDSGVFALELGTSADPSPSIVFYSYNP